MRYKNIINFTIILSISVSLFVVELEAIDDHEEQSFSTITIQSGDTLAGICRQYYGTYNKDLLTKILQANPFISNPNRIYSGKKLYLPLPNIKSSLKSYSSVLKKSIKPSSSFDNLKDTIIPSKHNFSTAYPPVSQGSFDYLKWIDDNTAIIKGRVRTDADCRFFVYVPGDLEYEQIDFKIEDDGIFQTRAIIGRKGRDYGKKFILKVVMFDEYNERIGDIRRTIMRQRHKNDEVVWSYSKSDGEIFIPGPMGWPGVERWIGIQKLDAAQSDNYDFQVPRGIIVANYRYSTYNPDEKYLSRYGRVTLYGSSCLAKALLLENKIDEAEKIIRVWAAQIEPDGKIPRSANVIGDNYISPDVRTGEVAHFLGAMAVAKKLTASEEWDEAIKKIVYQYLKPLINKKTGLVYGGYNGEGSDGYSKPYNYKMLNWCSAEHNFDVFQALTLISHLFSGSEFGRECYNMASTIAKGIDSYLWDSALGTFNRGWRENTGIDRAKALDCSSWGALYLLKQAQLNQMRKKLDASKRYIAKARRCLNYANRNFKTNWFFKTPDGKTGVIQGYRPYHGKIDDLRWEDGKNAGAMIDWDTMNSMVWSEGTLGVAMAWEELARVTNNMEERKYARFLYRQMLKLQSLSNQGGVLYSTEQIKGHFTMGEELASLSWLAYLASLNKKIDTNKKDTIWWMPW